MILPRDLSATCEPPEHLKLEATLWHTQQPSPVPLRRGRYGCPPSFSGGSRKTSQVMRARLVPRPPITRSCPKVSITVETLSYSRLLTVFLTETSGTTNTSRSECTQRCTTHRVT
eukprot:1041479-Prymnesium_polylepis.1